MAKKAVQTNAENFGYFNPPNVYRPEIIDIELVGEWNPEDGAINTYRITQNDGKIFDFDVKNGSGGSTGRGIVSIEEIETSLVSSGVNVIRVTFTDGTTSDFEVRNGAQGNKGDTGERGPVGVEEVNAEIGTNDPSEAPSVTKTFDDGVLGFTFNNIKGAKGDKGDPGVDTENYVTVEATDQTTAVTDLLPATGAENTLYRVANWDGTQYDASVYSVYAWYNSAYKKLATIENGIDDEPTADSENLVKSGGVAAQISQLGQKVQWIPDEMHNGYISGGVWTDLNLSSRQHKIISIPSAFVGKPLQIKSSTYHTDLAFLSSYSPEEGENTGIIDVHTNIPHNAVSEFTIPVGTTCIYLLWTSGTNRAPAVLTILDVNFLVDVKETIADLDIKESNDKKALSQQTNNVDVAANLIPLVQYKGYITSGVWTDIDSGTRTYKILSIEGAKQIHLIGGENTSTYAILSEYNPVNGTNNGIIVSSTNIPAGAEIYITIPNNAKYLYLLWESVTSRAPQKCEVDSVDYFLGTRGVLEKLSAAEKENKQSFGDIYDSPFNWVRGAINNTTGIIDTITAYRVTSNSIMRARRDTLLTIENGYRFIIGTYSSTGEWLGYSGTWSSQKTITKGTSYRVMIQKFPEDTSITADVDTFSSALHYQCLVQLIESLVPQESSILTLNPEEEVVPKISNLKRRYINYAGSATQYPPVLVLAHFSDIHADNDNLLRIKQFRDKYASYIDEVIQTGDLIGGSFNDGMPTAYAQTTDFLNVIGNHDSMNRVGEPGNYSWELVAQKPVYDLVLAPYISGWGVNQPDDAATNGYCYYYKDYSANAVRLVVLDNMHWDATQKAWFESVLAAAITAELDVIVAVHYPPFYINQEASNPFAAIDTAGNSVGFTNVEAANAVKAFINNGGNFICWLCGHIHQDVMGLGRQSDGFDNQLAISIATASVAPASIYSEMERVQGSRTQDCFNIVGIDTHSKTIKVMRVGANYDRYMRRKNTFSWNYSTGTMIYVD